jgi:hypothetical protein
MNALVKSAGPVVKFLLRLAVSAFILYILWRIDFNPFHIRDLEW